MYNVLSIVFVIIGSLIGAGFASGKEMFLFFSVYGSNGIYGIFISSFLICNIIYCVLYLVKKYNIEHYEDFLDFLCKKNMNSKKLNISLFLNSLVNIFLLVSFYVMIAGFSAFFVQEFNLPSISGALIISFLCFITFSKNINGIIKANLLLIPVLIFFIFIFGLKNISLTSYSPHINYITYRPAFNWFISSILYASYNSIILIPILITLKKYLKNKRSIFIICLICFIIFIILALIIFSLIQRIETDVNSIELPTVYVANMFGFIYKILYGIVLLISIFTSAISCGYGFLSNCTNSQKTYNVLNLFICISSVFVCNIGFSNLVNVLYPFFGVLGIIQICFIFYKCIEKNW